MTTITREEVKAFIEQIESDLSNGWEAQIFELKLARIALASLEAEPIGAFHILDQQVGATTDYIKDGEWPISNGVIEVYTAQPATVVPEKLPCSVELKPGLIIGKGCKTETLLTALRRRAEYYAKLEAMTPEERAKHGASIEAFKTMLPQPAPVDKEFIPKNLDKALGVVGVALPESKEEFNFQIERWIQRLIDRVIRYADEFKEQPVPVVPEEMNFSTACNFVQINGMAKEDRATLAMRAWNACRAAMLNGGKS
ncbi:Eaa protein [Salmonella enterica subsp. enterica serovar Livingstone]